MRFGIRIGPFWMSTSTRRRSRRSRRPRRAEGFHGVIRDEYGREQPCHYNHRTLEAAEECGRRLSSRKRYRTDAEFLQGNRLAAMSAEEYRRHLAEIDPAGEEQLRRREAAIDAEAEATLRRVKDELAAVRFECQACGNQGFELVSGEFGAVRMVVRCTSCGTLHKASEEGSGA